MFTDHANRVHNFKFLFVGPAQAGKERAVAQLARVLSDDPLQATGGWAFGASSCLGAAGGRIAVADIELHVSSASEQTIDRLRASSLGLEVVSCGRGPDGYETALHLYWLPVELVPGMLQTKGMAAEWLRGADGVVYVADGRAEREADNAAGLADLHTWLAQHEASTPISALHVIHHDVVAQPPALAIDGAPTFETVAETGAGIVSLARHLTAVAEHMLATRPTTELPTRRRRAKSTRRRIAA